MGDYNQKTKLQYKLLSGIYDLMDLFVFPAGKPNPRKGLADLLQNEDCKLLDICCGTGNTALAVAKKCPGIEITGVDLSKDMLKIARRKAEKSNLINVSFMEMDAANLGFGDGSYDAAAISLALHEMPQELINKVLAEAGRVLKPGGRLYIIDWEKPEDAAGAMLFSIFPAMFEPKSFKQFMSINWKELSRQLGFEYESLRHYNFTKLVTIFLNKKC